MKGIFDFFQRISTLLKPQPSAPSAARDDLDAARRADIRVH